MLTYTQNTFTNILVYNVLVEKINTHLTFTKFTQSFNKSHKEYQCWLPLQGSLWAWEDFLGLSLFGMLVQNIPHGPFSPKPTR